MGMRKLLLVLHPKAWRVQYGEEFLAYLEQVDLGPVVIVDVLRHAARLYAHARRRAGQICAALVVSALFEVLALRLGLTANIFWAPTTSARGLALAATVAPWLVLLRAAVAGRAPRRAVRRQASVR
jgi:hypothetical protein